MHDPALARTAGTLVQIAPSPRPDEGEAGAATRALHIWRERMKAHGRISAFQSLAGYLLLRAGRSGLR
jgi:hypothetical protein